MSQSAVSNKAGSQKSIYNYTKKNEPEKRPATSSVSTDDEASHKPPSKSSKTNIKKVVDTTSSPTSFESQVLKQLLDIKSSMCTKDGLDDALIIFENKLLEKFDKKLEKIEAELFDLKADKDQLHKELESANKVIESQKQTITELQNNCEKAIEHSIRNEQYSRRSNICIHGLVEKQSEDSPQVVIDFLQDKLNIKLSATDLDAAHRIPIQDKTKPRPLIVKFLRRSHRDAVIKKRSNLKGSGISIHEDLTSDNQKLLVRVKSHAHVENAWSQNGNIYAKLKSGSIHKITRSSNIDTIDAGGSGMSNS